MTTTIVLAVEPDFVIRSFEAGDAESLFALIDRHRSFLRTWLPWLDMTRAVEDTRMFIEGTLQQLAVNNGFQAGLWNQGRFGGGLGYHRIDWLNRATSLGYWWGEEFQGRGMMTKACRAMVSYAFDRYHLHRVEIRCAEGNVKSRAIPERLGFRPEGKIREAEWLYDHFVDHMVYGMLAPDWFEREVQYQASSPGTMP